MVSPMNSNPEMHILEPSDKAQASVIWLHGLGADGHDFEPIVPELGLPANAAIRFIFPHAPKQAVTINGGMVMRAWYDIRQPQINADMDEQGIEKSSQILQSLIQAQIAAGIRSDKILLAGFSQGGVIALHCGLRFAQPLAGILALSTYSSDLQHPPNSSITSQAPPILMMHGEFDPIVPIQLAQASYQRLQQLGGSTQWAQYPMAHQVCIEQIQAIGLWMKQILHLD